MFDGGFQLGVTVNAVEELPCDWPVRPGVVDRPSRLGEILPVAVRSDAELARDLRRITELRSVLAGFEAELVVELASRRPAAADTPIGRSGAAELPAHGVSEFFADELALILNCSRTGATVLFEQAVTLTRRLPETWAALADGRLDWPRARAIAAELGAPADGSDPEVIAAVEAAVLPRAAGLSIRRLRELARRELISRDAAAAERRRVQAAKTADVSARPVGDGMGELVARGPWAETAAMRETVDRYARMQQANGDSRPIGVLRHEVLRDLILRPWDTTRPPVTARLTIDADLDALGATVTAPGERAPTGSVDGSPVTAAHLQELLRRLDACGVQPAPGGAAGVAIRDRTGRLIGTATLGELRDLTRHGCPTHPQADCGCAVLGRPEEVARYRPSAGQRRFVSTRDRSCRHPGCHSRAGWADQDHVIPYDHGGPTDCDNLTILCLVKPPPRSFRRSATRGCAGRVGRPSGRRRPRGRRSA